MTRTKSEQEWAADYLGRLWELPLVEFRPFTRPIPELWWTAPPALRKRASRPWPEAHRKAWEALRDPEQLGTAVARDVPLWIPEHDVGYVLDFLLPEYGVNVQIETWEAWHEEGDCPEIDFDAFPDHCFNDERDWLLDQCFGIQVVSAWDVNVCRLTTAEFRHEIRCELGLGRPPWMQHWGPGPPPRRE